MKLKLGKSFFNKILSFLFWKSACGSYGVLSPEGFCCCYVIFYSQVIFISFSISEIKFFFRGLAQAYGSHGSRHAIFFFFFYHG